MKRVTSRKRKFFQNPATARILKNLQAHVYALGAAAGRPDEVSGLFEAACRPFLPTLPFRQILEMSQACARRAADSGDPKKIEAVHRAIVGLFDALKAEALVPLPHRDDAKVVDLAQRDIAEDAEAHCAVVRVLELPTSREAIDAAVAEVVQSQSAGQRLLDALIRLRDQLHLPHRPSFRVAR